MSWEYENIMLIGDFNLNVENITFEVFINIFDLQCLFKKPTCFNLRVQVQEVRIFDQHSLILTVLRSQLVKGNAKKTLYRDYNSFYVQLFKKGLNKNLKSNKTVNFSDFQNTFITILHKHAPIKKKFLRFNKNPFMSKALRKAIMYRSQKKGRC